MIYRALVNIHLSHTGSVVPVGSTVSLPADVADGLVGRGLVELVDDGAPAPVDDAFEIAAAVAAASAVDAASAADVASAQKKKKGKK